MDIATLEPLIWQQALQVFGSEAKAQHWLGTRLWELGDRTPEQTLLEGRDSEAVEAVLGRIEYGVFI